ncbi:MAG: CorA family divalent cation transporter [Bacteroidales bacterium]
MEAHSHHNFFFPFQWSFNSKERKLFTQKVSIKDIKPKTDFWINIPKPTSEESEVKLYNEQNYFYPFVHRVLYDKGNDNTPIIKHYERTESLSQTHDLEYVISVKAAKTSTYKLTITNIILDIFSTGTGVLIFYTKNLSYPHLDDILRIQQFGRRILPPFMGKDNLVEGSKLVELADSIGIVGLRGQSSRYYEDFTSYKPGDDWRPARFIRSLIEDFSTQIEIKPVIDDRMFVMSYVINNSLSSQAENNYETSFINSKKVYSLIFVDASEPTCQNKEMRIRFLKDAINPRWQKYGTIYGITRYSFLVLVNSNTPPFILDHFKTMYSRMVELVLIQRASILRFSGEVTYLSNLSRDSDQNLVEKISDFYKAYIQFVNQIYFREITAQDQGIELYDKLQEKMRLDGQVKDLDDEISELHQYATILEDAERNESLKQLTILGTIFLIPTLVTSFLGMNLVSTPDKSFISLISNYFYLIPGLILAPLFAYLSLKRQRKKFSRYLLLGLTTISMLLTIIIHLIKYKC